MGALEERPVLVERSPSCYFYWRIAHLGTDVFDAPREFSGRMYFHMLQRHKTAVLSAGQVE
jgi:hypothetical protein